MLKNFIAFLLAASLDSGGISLHKWLTLESGATNLYGEIGVMINRQSRQIIRVRKISPAATAGLLKKDIIVSADGHESIDYIDGMAYTTVHLVIKRGSDQFEVDIERAPKSEVRD